MRSTRFTGQRIHTGLSSIIVLAILIIIQLIAVKHNARFDLTANKRHSLSEQTVNILNALETPINASCFVSETEPLYLPIKDLLERYAAQTDRFTFQFIDIDREPLKAQQFKIDPKEAYSVTVLTQTAENGDGYRKITTATENDLTNAILKLTRGDATKTVYLLTGHGEKDLDSEEATGGHSLKSGLENANYGVSELNLVAEKTVPENCAALGIIGPSIDPSREELDAIQTYLDNGGDLIVALDPQVSCPNLIALLAKYGIIVGNDLIVDPNGFQHVLQPVIGDYGDHPITRNFNYLIILNLARSVTPAEESTAGMTIVTLARTSENAWAETNLSNLENFEPELNESEDIKGPVPVAVVSETQPAQPDSAQTVDSVSNRARTRIIAIGDSDFADNYFMVTNTVHTAFIMNAFHYLTDETDLIAIPPVETLHQPLNLTQSQVALAFWIPVVLLPLVILGWGGIRIYERRKAG